MSPTLQQHRRGLIGDPDKNADIYRADSPMSDMDQEKPPSHLGAAGRRDIRAPKGQAEPVIAKLEANGLTVDALPRRGPRLREVG